MPPASEGPSPPVSTARRTIHPPARERGVRSRRASSTRSRAAHPWIMLSPTRRTGGGSAVPATVPSRASRRSAGSVSAAPSGSSQGVQVKAIYPPGPHRAQAPCSAGARPSWSRPQKSRRVIAPRWKTAFPVSGSRVYAASRPISSWGKVIFAHAGRGLLVVIF